MNFISTFEELNKLYEEVDSGVEKEEAEKEEVVEESCDKKLTEATEDDVVEDEVPADEEAPVEEPVVEDEPRRVICECDKCGALVIKDEADIVNDEESGLVNVEDECEFCEEANGYKIVGVVAPYEVADEEVPAEDPVEEPFMIEESLDLASHSNELNILASKLVKQLFPNDISKSNKFFVKTYPTKNELGSGGHIAIMADSDNAPFQKAAAEAYLKKAVVILKNLGYNPEIAVTKEFDGKYWSVLDNIVKSEVEALEELLDFTVPVSVTANDNEVAVGGATI